MSECARVRDDRAVTSRGGRAHLRARRTAWIYLVASFVVWFVAWKIMQHLAGAQSIAADTTKVLGYFATFGPPVIWEWRSTRKRARAQR